MRQAVFVKQRTTKKCHDILASAPCGEMALRYDASMSTTRGIPFATWETTLPERLADGVTWRSFEVAASDAAWTTLCSRFGEPHPDVDFLEGIGPMKAWMSRFPCGCELAVWEVQGMLGRSVCVLSNDADLDHVLHHFALPVTWRVEPKDAPIAGERWSVFRQDDNGNRFRIRDFDSMFSAECARREFEGRGHKQLYTIEKSEVRPD